jgi:predicted ATP-grasp superfamily ATP-dependent carboligase
MPVIYFLSLNPTSYGIYKNLHDSSLDLHMFHKGGGLRSLLDKRVVIHPYSIEEDAEAIIDAISNENARTGEMSFVFTSSDYEITFLDRYAEQVRNIVSIPIQTQTITQIANDKYLFFRKMQELDIPSPHSVCVDCTHLDTIPSNLAWPYLIKPNHPFEWKVRRAADYLSGKKAFCINGTDELSSMCQYLQSFTSMLLLQEIIDVADDGNYSFCCYSDNTGKVLWSFVTQKLLQYPENFGTAILCRTVKHTEVAAFGKRIIESLGVQGISETEIIIERQTGNLFALEINARHWLQHRLSNCLGVNMTLLDYYYRSGDIKKVEAILEKTDTDKRAYWIDEIALALYSLKHPIHNKRSIIHELQNSIIEFSILERYKPGPLLFLAKKMARQLIG